MSFGRLQRILRARWWALVLIAMVSIFIANALTDFRNDPVSRPIGQVHQKTEAALASATNQARLLSFTPLLIQPKNSVCVLSPGFGFEVGSSVQNTSFHFGFNWRERAVEPSELKV